MLDLLDARFMQIALAELLLLAGLSGVLGPWIILRRLAFFTHAAGTVTFPGLVLAAAWGIAAAPMALACALAYALGLERLARREGHDAATGLLLVGALAVGAILASDLANSGAGVDTLLFGTLVGLDAVDLALTAMALVLALALDRALGRAWLVQGFDPVSAPALGIGRTWADRALLAVVAAAVVVALSAVGALLVSVLLVVPAATVRLLTDRMATLRAGTGALAAGEGVVALAAAAWLDIPVGPALAVVAGSAFAAVAAAGAVGRRAPVPA